MSGESNDRMAVARYLNGGGLDTTFSGDGINALDTTDVRGMMRGMRTKGAFFRHYQHETGGMRGIQRSDTGVW